MFDIELRFCMIIAYVALLHNSFATFQDTGKTIDHWRKPFLLFTRRVTMNTPHLRSVYALFAQSFAIENLAATINVYVKINTIYSLHSVRNNSNLTFCATDLLGFNSRSSNAKVLCDGLDGAVN